MNKIKRTMKDYKPRHNYVTMTCNRTEEGNVWDNTSSVDEYQTILAVGPSVTDLKPGDKVKFERTAFPSSDAVMNQNADADMQKLNDETEARLEVLDKSKGNKTLKDAKRQELRMEFTDKLKAIQALGKSFAIPVYKDDMGEEFIWASDRSINFSFVK